MTIEIFYLFIEYCNRIIGYCFINELMEFESKNINDDTYFPEILWQERTTPKWDIKNFYSDTLNGNDYLGVEYNPILISMDGTRKINEIKSYIGNKNIFSCTYDSVDIMKQLLDNLDNIFIIVDEFHNLSFNNLNNVNDHIFQIINHEKTIKQLYLSATPIKKFKCDQIYEYKWSDAINNKYICDFDIIIHENNKELYKFSSLLNTLCSKQLNIKLVGKVYFILKGMLFNGNRKCICYMTCTEKALEIKNIIYWMSKLLNINVDTWIINCHTARTNRQKYLTEFKNNKLLSIMINVHILDEGIDIPECDSVFITKPNYNIINIVQRMCRANRIQENKEKCYIYLWCQKKKTDNIINYLSNNTNGFTNNKVIKLSIMNDKIDVKNYTNIKTSTNFLDILNDKNDKNDSIYNFEIMKNYFKKFSTVPHDFISDFFIILKEYTDNEIIIDFELLCKWLNVRKDSLKRVLLDNFEQNFDYTINTIRKQQKDTKRTSTYEKILITPYCMKELCMISQTAKAKEVRKYLIEIEQFLRQLSTLPLDFISDFYIIAKEEYTDNEIIINFDTVCKWLNVLKKNLKVILINNFEQNFDYTINTIRKQQKDIKRTSTYDEILITPNCMKELCMISQTAKAKEVRKYFIEMILTHKSETKEKN